MPAVSLLCFGLEALHTVHITKLQTFSTGNRTLKREVYFITLQKVPNKKMKRSCGLAPNGFYACRNRFCLRADSIAHIWNFCVTSLILCLTSSDVTHLMFCSFICVITDKYLSSAICIHAGDSLVLRSQKNTCSRGLFPICISNIFSCKHCAYHKH